MTIEKLNSDFDAILKEIINPFFKGLKFRKKGQNYARISNDITQTFTVQKNLLTTSFDKLYFAFSFGFFNIDIYNIGRDKEMIIDFPTTDDCFIQNPLGLYSHKRDHWYELSSRIDTRNVALNVKTDLESYLKPLFNTYKSLDELIHFTEVYDRNKLFTSPYEYIAFLMLTNRREKGELLIKDYYKKAIALKGPVKTNEFPYRQAELTNVSDSAKLYLDNIMRLANHFKVSLEKNT